MYRIFMPDKHMIIYTFLFIKDFSMNRILLLSCCFFLSSVVARGQLVINEVMQSNINMVYADDDFPDSWVELYSPTNVGINLRDWKLSVKDDIAKAYAFDIDTIVPARGYLLIYCDKEAYGVHTDERVDSGKGVVVLYNPSGMKADMVSLAKMPAPEISYGRIGDGAAEWGYMVDGTPGKANSTVTSKELLPAPVYSVAGGLFPGPVKVSVSIPDGVPSDALLCVTTDGREPSASDMVFGKSVDLTIERSTPVRAKLMSRHALNPLSVCHTYILHPEATQLGVVCMSTDPDNFWSADRGIFHGEPDDENPNFKQDWRRPVNIEYFSPMDAGGHECTINQLGETALKGSSTRVQPQKSMKVYANKRFGVKRFDTGGMWPEKPGVAEVKSFELRNSGQDFYYSHVRDVLIQTLCGRNCNDVDWQAYRPVILYLNGEYRGIIDLRERTNEDHVEANYDGLEDIDMVENCVELQSGTMDAFNRLLETVSDPDVTYSRIEDMVDVYNFLTGFTANYFGAGFDYMGNNVVAWRRWDDGAKWRWIMKDYDFWGGWGDTAWDYDYYSYIISGDNWEQQAGLTRTRALYRRFIESDVAKDKFLDKMLVSMGDYLQYDYIEEVIDELQAAYEPEYRRHLGVYNTNIDYAYSYWQRETVRLKEWLKKRIEYLYGHLAERFGLSGYFDLTVDRRDFNTVFNSFRVSRPV